MLYSPTFFAMAFANLCVLSSFSSFFLLPLFISSHGGSQVDIGIIMGSFALSSVLCRPWTSQMIDRIGRKRSYTVGSLIMILLPLTYLFFQGDLSQFYFPLLLVRLAHGVGLAICITAAFTYATDIIPAERLNEGIGIFGISGLSGMAIGPVVAEIIIRDFGFYSFFLAASGIAMLGFLAHLPLAESYIVHTSGHSSQPFFSVLKKRSISSVSLLAFCFGFGMAASSTFVSPFAKEQQLGFISFYYIAYSAAAVLTRLVGGRIADRIGEKQVIPYALAMTGAGLLTLILAKQSAVLILSGLMTGCGHGFLFPSLSAMAIRGESIEIRGKITGIFTGSIDAGTFIGAILLGYIGEWAGFQALFSAAGLSLFVGLWLFRFQAIGK